MIDLSCTLCGVELRNPFVLASGILGTHASLLQRVGRSGAGAVTAKSCGPDPRRGHPNPTVVDWGHGLINAVGLPNPGVEQETELLREARKGLSAMGVALIASIFADSPERFAETARTVAGAEPDLLEMNVSCPNVHSDFGEPFGASASACASVVRAVRGAVSIPVIVKLTPAVGDIARIARVCEDEGADAICAINTMPGMVVDPETGAPILSNTTGGISGPALKPIALRCVYAVAREVSIPIIGTGGVSCGADAVEMMSAGATAVGVGTALRDRGPDGMASIARELEGWMSARGFTGLAELRGRTLGFQGPPIDPTPPPIPGENRHE